MAAFSYKKSVSTTMKLVGELNTETGTIIVDGDMKNLLNTLADFDGQVVTVTVKNSYDEELDEPIEYIDEE